MVNRIRNLMILLCCCFYVYRVGDDPSCVLLLLGRRDSIRTKHLCLGNRDQPPRRGILLSSLIDLSICQIAFRRLYLTQYLSSRACNELKE
jgi:hypothetical protein